jgi:hypothetical protein
VSIAVSLSVDLCQARGCHRGAPAVGLIDQQPVKYARDRLDWQVALDGAKPGGSEHRAGARCCSAMTDHVTDKHRQRPV